MKPKIESPENLVAGNVYDVKVKFGQNIWRFVGTFVDMKCLGRQLYVTFHDQADGKKAHVSWWRIQTITEHAAALSDKPASEGEDDDDD